MTGPSGKYYLIPENASDFNYVFFATGTGIAPFRGMVLDLLEAGVKSQIALILGVPYRTDILYADFFKELAQKHPNFHFITAISREERNADGSRNYVQTKIRTHGHILQPMLKADNGLIYVCGMKGMETGIYQELNILGITGYTEVKEELAGKSAAEWTSEDIKKYVRSNNRVFVEVY
jgi:ferredoxin--NADP+ reductase